MQRVVLAFLVVLPLLGCTLFGLGSDESTEAEQVVVEEAPVDPVAPSPVDAIRNEIAERIAGQPCPVGYWEAEDFMAAIRESLKAQKELQGTAFRQLGGSLMLHFSPVDSSAGELEVRANDIEHSVSTNMRGMNANVTHTMSGAARLGFSITSEDQMRFADPSENTISARIRMSIGRGIGFDREVDTPFDVAGSYGYKCDGDAMTIHRGADDGYDITLTRISAEAFEAGASGGD